MRAGWLLCELLGAASGLFLFLPPPLFQNHRHCDQLMPGPGDCRESEKGQGVCGGGYVLLAVGRWAGKRGGE